MFTLTNSQIQSRDINEKEKEYLNKKSKRERRVFPNQMLCHVWANQSQSSGRNANGSLYFENERIYSYGSHYLAGKIFTDKKGKKFALVNNYNYSNTTSKQLSDIRSALRGKMEFFCVPDCYDVDSEVNRNYFLNAIISEIESIFNFRKTSYSDDISHLKMLIKEYNDFFAIVGKPSLDITEEQLEELAFLQKEKKLLKDVSRNSEKAKAAFLKRIKPKLDFYNSLVGCSVETLIRDFKEFRKNGVQGSVPYDLQITYKERLRLKEFKIELPEFERVLVEYDYLRVNEEKGIVETSRGANVPLDHAVRLLKMILKNEAKKGERVGHFTLDAIKDDPKGDKTVCIGCHRILLSDAKRTLDKFLNGPGLKLV